MNFFPINEAFKGYTDDVTAEFQDSCIAILTSTNNITGHVKNQPILTMPFGCDKVSTALENYRNR